MLLAILAVIIIAALSKTVLFRISEVNIEGESAYSADEIMQAGNIEIGVNLTGFDKKRAETAVMDSLPRLDGVEIKRIFGFPSKISVTVEGAEKSFNVPNSDGYLEVSRNGRIIGAEPQIPQGLIMNGLLPFSSQDSPKVGDYIKLEPAVSEDENPGGIEQVKVQLAFELCGLIEKHELVQVGQVDVSDKFDIKMLYDGGRIEIRLGAPSALDEKLAVAANIITNEIADAEKGILRVSNPNKATFKPIMQ
jgi:cell division protein FtsQ